LSGITTAPIQKPALPLTFILSGTPPSIEHAFAQVSNSRKTFQRLLEKVRTFDESRAGRLIAERDCQALDQMVLDHLRGLTVLLERPK